MPPTHKQRWNRRHGFDSDKSHTLRALARYAGLPVSTLQTVYNRGIGAHRTNPASVRLRGSYRKHPSAPLSARLSPEQWAFARVYAFVNKLETNTLNHDTDLVPPFRILASTRQHKKYMAVFDDGRPSVHFGDSRYQQYKDSTGVGKYSHLNHGDAQRRANYYSRHGRHPKAFTPKWFSHRFLW